MRPIGPSLFAAGLLGVTMVALAAIGPPSARRTVVVNQAPAKLIAPTSVAAGGFKLTTTTIDLPIDDADYPAGPNVDVVNANCRACHSASMVLLQPRLSGEQWQATISKMRDVYKAPVDDRDTAAILAYLTAMPSQAAAPVISRASAGGAIRPNKSIF